MARQNRREEHVAATFATVAIGAAVGYGAYKLFGSLFKSNEPHRNQPNPNGEKPETIPFSMTSPHRFPRDSKIYVVNTTDECRYAMKELKSHCDEVSLLGFDCEWVSSPYHGRHKVALLQLASHRGLCVLVRLSDLEHIPEELEEILENRNIVKVGVKPKSDAEYLTNDYLPYDSSIQGTLELGRVARIANQEGFKRGLGFMSEEYLGVTLDKDPKIRCSDWEADTLSHDQIMYSALDVLVAIELFKYFTNIIEPDGNIFTTPLPVRMRKVINACSVHLDKDDDEF